MSSNSLRFSASAIWKLVLSAIGIPIITGFFLSIRIYHQYKAINDVRSLTIQDWIFAGAVVSFIPVFTGLPISFGSELPILVDVPSSTIAKISVTSDICSMITFLWDVAVFYYCIMVGPRWKAAAFGVPLILLSLAAITLNILEWTIRRIDMYAFDIHAFATALASIRILITVLVLVRLLFFIPKLWKIKISLKKKISLIFGLICGTGVGTMPFPIYYLIYKEEGLSTEILGCRIFEAGLNLVFICFPQALKVVLRWLGKNDGATRETIYSLRTKITPLRTSGCFKRGQDLESQKGHDGRPRRFSKREWSEEGHDVEVLGSQSSESFR